MTVTDALTQQVSGWTTDAVRAALAEAEAKLDRIYDELDAGALLDSVDFRVTLKVRSVLEDEVARRAA